MATKEMTAPAQPASAGPVVPMLNKVLATLVDLHAQTKHAHWNVRGPNFIAVHKLFDELADDVTDLVDEVGERITALGGVANGTVRAAAASSELDDFPANVRESQKVLALLSDRYKATRDVCKHGIDPAEDADDPATADLLTQAVRELDKAIYFLDAHLS